jgi:uncharacterized membrane protein YgcG
MRTPLILTIIASGILTGCSNEYDVKQNVTRGAYSSKEQCLKDWNDPSDCEEKRVNTSSGSRVIYWGPYHTPTTAYGYDGQVRTGNFNSSNAASSYTTGMSQNNIYSSSGKYLTSPAHSNASASKLSAGRASSSFGRGGFSSGGGRGASVSGG